MTRFRAEPPTAPSACEIGIVSPQSNLRGRPDMLKFLMACCGLLVVLLLCGMADPGRAWAIGESEEAHASQTDNAEVTDRVGSMSVAPAEALWRGMVVLVTGAVLSTVAYAVARRRSRLVTSCEGMASLEMAAAESARRDIETLAQEDITAVKEVLKDWLEEESNT
ncbi:MAG: hypothetical protein KAW17_10425 [Candidatus Eisenbacteria sp.]|nr:hypothetical protein [Candidatus Eisenbacteria bacterium]